VFLYRPSAKALHVTAVDRGSWMRFDDLDAAPWETVPGGSFATRWRDLVLPPFRAIARACYCDQGVELCDFCACLRRLPPEVIDA
jgi:hypothetical protein